ncbi:hypothetical protein ABIG06_005257 [Bradyrhizobium sp. USDA 326]
MANRGLQDRDLRHDVDLENARGRCPFEVIARGDRGAQHDRVAALCDKGVDGVYIADIALHGFEPSTVVSQRPLRSRG